MRNLPGTNCSHSDFTLQVAVAQKSNLVLVWCGHYWSSNSAIMGETTKEAANLDQILEHYVGGAGKYQVINTIIMAFVYYAGNI